jgi:hypothetical protein
MTCAAIFSAIRATPHSAINVFILTNRSMDFNKPNHRTNLSAFSFFHIMCFSSKASSFLKPFKLIFAFFLLLPLLSLTNRKQDKIGFTVSLSKPHPVVGDTIEIIFKAPLPKGFHLYSEKSDCPADDGPLRAEWSFIDTAHVEFLGKAIGIGDHMVRDEDIFHCSTSEFEGMCEFRQKVYIFGPVESITGSFNGQKCSADGTCFQILEDVLVPLHVH